MPLRNPLWPNGCETAYPGYPSTAACLAFGSDFTFGARAWELAEAHSMHAPTYHYRYDYAPRTLQWTGFGATHASELLAVFDVYDTRLGALLTWRGTAARRAASVGTCSGGGGRSAGPGCPATTGRATHRASARR